MLRSIVRTACVPFLFAALVYAQQPASAPAPAPGSAVDLVLQGQKLSRDGKLDDALALYSKALDKSPDLYEAHLAVGAALALKGASTDAPGHYPGKVIVAPADSNGQA